MIKLCIIIPVYNHEDALPQTLASLQGQGLPCLVVDDGSSEACRSVLEALAQKESPWVTLIRLESNQGKGTAVTAGCREAARRGYTHALQIDADGQHESGDLPRFIEAAQRYPQAIICGQPLFDASMPAARRYGRMLTQLWISINTLSFSIRDAMCGFRVYPLNVVLPLMDEGKLGKRMDFDPELLVRLSWTGVRMVSVPTQVRYPIGGRSHFKLGLDNWLISRMHARLFFGMLARFPQLLWNKWQAARIRPEADGPM